MNASEFVTSIIENIPSLMEYFVPGFVAIFIYRKISDISTADYSTEAIHLGASVVLSYTFRSIIVCLGKIPGIPTVSDSFLLCFVSTLLGIFLVLIIIKVKKHPKVRSVYSKINNTTLSDNVFECCNLSKAPDVIVYGDDKFIKGRLWVFGTGTDTWLAIDQFEVYSNEKGLIDHWTHHSNYTQYIIPYNEIKAIEVKHKKGSALDPDWYDAHRTQKQEAHNRKIDSTH